MWNKVAESEKGSIAKGGKQPDSWFLSVKLVFETYIQNFAQQAFFNQQGIFSPDNILIGAGYQASSTLPRRSTSQTTSLPYPSSWVCGQALM